MSQKLRSSFIYFIFSLSMLFLFSDCYSTKKINRKSKKHLIQSIEKSPVFSKNFTGFSLYDPKHKEFVYSFQDDKYFTPASNTKIFTLYTCLHLLGDSIPTLKYVIKKDSLIFWGMGDPSFLHPYLEKEHKIANFLRLHKGKLFFSSHNFKDQRFGAGWAWDDFPYYYQPEKSPMPIHGNIIQFNREIYENDFDVRPPFFSSFLQHDPTTNGVRRMEGSNIFLYNKDKRSQYKSDLPFKYSDSLFVKLFATMLQREVQLYKNNTMPPIDAKTLYTHSVDEAYSLLMQASDNFIAEQLLLVCSAVISDTLNNSIARKFVLEKLLTDLPDKAIWKDGSGLSRYNLFTPRTIVKVLEKIYQKIPTERLFKIFPAGGKSGTIKNWYNADVPYLYAKTGTLSNKHCLSGYIITKSGQILIFSFMHNNYINGSTPLKEEMEKVLNYIHNNS